MSRSRRQETKEYFCIFISILFSKVYTFDSIHLNVKSELKDIFRQKIFQVLITRSAKNLYACIPAVVLTYENSVRSLCEVSKCLSARLLVVFYTGFDECVRRWSGPLTLGDPLTVAT